MSHAGGNGNEPLVAPSSGLIVLAIALMAIGLVMVASATASLDRSVIGDKTWSASLGRQIIFVIAGVIILIATTRVSGRLLDSTIWRRRAVWTLGGIALVGLVAALIPGLGDAQHGSHRWLRFTALGMSLGIQPSELAKPALIALLAWLLCDRGVDPRSFRKSFMPATIVLAVSVALVGCEDFGTAVLLAGVGGLMLLVAGSRPLHLLGIGTVGAMGLAGLILAAPYRLERIAAYRDLWADPYGSGYQPLQSLASIATGGWMGTGLGAGIQKYGYLPEGHTDFIFAVICEETGILGASLVIVLLTLVVAIGLRTMWRAASPFERLLAFGLTALTGLQAAMNIAVVTVVAPTTGISLPLISAGGSGILTYSLIIGLLGAIADRGQLVPHTHVVSGTGAGEPQLVAASGQDAW